MSLLRRAASPARRRVLWGVGWLSGALAGSLWLGVDAYHTQRAAFETDARIAHRLLSQQVVQHEAVLATMRLLQPADNLQLKEVYPQFLAVRRRAPEARWAADDAAMARAEALSARSGRPELATVAFAAGRFSLVVAPGRPDGSAYALEIALPLVVPWAEWPTGRRPEEGRSRLWLEHGGQEWTINPGVAGAPWGRFVFRKHLAAESQPFDLVAERAFTPADLPWGPMLLWSAVWAGVLAGVAAWRRQLQARQRAEELLRLGQVARLNALGELAAGLAHEVNQPLTAVLASTQAAARLLAGEPPEIDDARQAMTQAVQQGRRAADVVARLRRAVERPNPGGRRGPVELSALAGGVLQLLEPECRRRHVVATLNSADDGVTVSGDPVAIEQIVHNLVGNALQALEQNGPGARTLEIAVARENGQGVLRVRDNGPGVGAELAPRVFEPFVSTREGGLGLGLSLCQTLAQEMGGNLRLEPSTGPGAVFRLELPLFREGASA